MKLGKWWKRRSGWAKAVTILAALAMLQVGLCFTTPVTVLPIHDAIYGKRSDAEVGLGLVVWQFLLCGITFGLLALATIVAGFGGHFSAKEQSTEDSND
jgi:hypothetical protein